VTTTRRRARVRAPQLVGEGGWIGTGGRELSLADLGGKIVLLDFWTFCCVNCLHVIDELRPVEERYADVLVTVGVHSPKFEHETEHAAVLAAVERYDVDHPVLDDPRLTTWDAYAVRAWPTLVVVDPEGYEVARMSGEGHAHGLAALLDELVAEHDAKGTLRRGDGPYVAPPALPGPLRFPSSVLILPSGNLLATDVGNNRVVELAPDGAGDPVRAFGSGVRGREDGSSATASFVEPNGVCLLPADVAAEVGYDVVVADTVNHLLRGLTLSSGSVKTIAGTGHQRMPGDAVPVGRDPLLVTLSSPWDVAWSPQSGAVVVAMAGPHQLWTFDPATGALAVLAGTTNEGLRDGSPQEAWLAQPSGLAVQQTDDGERIWFVDAETSSLRHLSNGAVVTDVGQGLFDFGHVDGPAATALFQHPLGLCLLPDGSVAVADTYNGALRRFDPASGEVTTLATGLGEPSGAVARDDGTVLVVESSAHRLTAVRLPRDATRVDGGARRTVRTSTDVAAGELELVVVFDPPPGEKLDDRYGPSTRLLVSSTPPELLLAGDGSGPELTRPLRLDPDVPGGVLHVAVFAASCDDPDAPDAAEFPACHVHQQDWGVPVRLTPGGTSRLELHLRG
jgi:thiol-disulfide isomerase/thioredoxin